MGEVVLRRIQAGVETTRGTAVAATKKLYGTLTMTRAQARRYAVEDRGAFTDKFRGNPKLVEAGFTLVADATFEDMPLFAALFLNGGASSTGSGTVGYTWAISPDTTTDSLKTLTLEAGDDAVAWQGPFSTVDTADFTLALDNALSASMVGFSQEWWPATSGNLATGFTGFTGSLSERVVESAMGWQQRLYIDPDSVTPGTTQVVGRLKSAAFGYHNQNKRKYFGDASALFTKLGRGRRQTHCQIVFEAPDTAQYADFYNAKAKVVRLQLIGGPITGTTLGTTSGVINAGTVTSIPVSALAQSIAGGSGISVGGVTFAVTAAGAASAATSIPVQSQTVLSNIAGSTTVMAAKTMNFDWWGIWDSFVIGNVDTNTTFQLDLQGVYSVAGGKETQITVVNGNTAL